MKVILGVALAVLIIGCAQSAPKCDDERTKKAVIELYGRRFYVAADQLARFSLDNVRGTDFNKDVGKWTCAGDIRIDGASALEWKLVYLSELSDGGKTHLVSIVSAE